MITIEKLQAFGANTQEGLARCYGNEALYLRLVGMIPAEQNFEKLRQAIEAQEIDAAFEAAHALKGVLGNLSLTPIYAPCVELTELLRAKKPTQDSGYLEEVLAQRDVLAALCAD